MYKKHQKIHLIGIGGIGMSGIAELLARMGFQVQGSDNAVNDTTKRLESLGIDIKQGHSAHHVHTADVVVFSSAISSTNPEYVEAVAKKIPILPRAQMLAELMRLKYGIAIAGAHGKTTTTSMMATVLSQAGLDPTVVVGGRMDNFGGTNARLGNGDFMVVEADESDGSFNRLAPCLALVTNIDQEHMDHYGNMHELRNAFLTFMNRVPFFGGVVVCGDDPHIQMLLSELTSRKITYGENTNNDYRLLKYTPTTSGSCSIISNKDKTENLELSVHGKHNALNALGALALCDELGISRQDILSGLKSFSGVQRRFQIRGERDGVLFIDDYAHHPNEIRATLAAAREKFGARPIHVIFQPHRYTRTALLIDNFATCFKEAKHVWVLPVYAAGETAIDGINPKTIADTIKQMGTDATASENALDTVLMAAKENPNGVIMTMGAGDLPKVYHHLF